MTAYTIDASVCLKWFSSRNEPDITQAQNLYQQAWDRKIALLAPNFLKIEVTNVLLKKKLSPIKQVLQALDLLHQMDIVFIEESDEIIGLASTLANQHQLSVYDGIYLATANTTKTNLISADYKHHAGITSVIRLDKFIL